MELQLIDINTINIKSFIVFVLQERAEVADRGFGDGCVEEVRIRHQMLNYYVNSKCLSFFLTECSEDRGIFRLLLNL